ncbi:MAG: hypothetical protein JSU68_06570 [Phycisphaerales bacterium]|nr:MAG: hypothetical protein JSU68_06570 [Phycisphaerales bacterium]
MAILAGMVFVVTGCQDPAEQFGKTYYLDGAGNWGFGVSEVPAGLRAAGYQGSVEVFLWTSSFNPAIDQVNEVGNKFRAGILSGKIDDYLRRHPDKDVNIIALSAGTGIATWAVEGLSNRHKINNLVLLGSSLSYDYDMTEALAHIKGKVYVYYSSHDEVLTTGARALGTVDRKFVDGAGLRGLHPKGRNSPRVVNIGWTSRYSALGWTGAHTDATSQAFVQREIAPRILGRPGPARSRRPRAAAVPDHAAGGLAGVPTGIGFSAILQSGGE